MVRCPSYCPSGYEIRKYFEILILSIFRDNPDSIKSKYTIVFKIVIKIGQIMIVLKVLQIIVIINKCAQDHKINDRVLHIIITFREILRSYLRWVNPMIVSKKIPKSENRNLKEQNLKIIECHPDRSKCQQTNSLYVIMEVIKPRLFKWSTMTSNDLKWPAMTNKS